jgi:hypothetical protein
MTEMREWLNEHRFEPSIFTYEPHGNIFTILLKFNKDAEAEAFKRRFDGEDACYNQRFSCMDSWHPMAEELCNTADEFSSTWQKRSRRRRNDHLSKALGDLSRADVRKVSSWDMPLDTCLITCGCGALLRNALPDRRTSRHARGFDADRPHRHHRNATANS